MILTPTGSPSSPGDPVLKQKFIFWPVPLKVSIGEQQEVHLVNSRNQAVNI